MTKFKVGDRVVANVTMVNDLAEDGMGRSHCCSKGDLLIVREVNSGYLNCIIVSHEDEHDRAFCCAPTEIELEQ